MFVAWWGLEGWTAHMPEISEIKPDGKFLYDTVTARIAAQAADQAALAGRAKDLLGVAAISTTVSGALVNDKLTDVTKGAVSLLLFLLTLLGLACVVAGALYAFRPRTWYFSPEPKSAAERISANPDSPTDDYYAAVANGFIALKPSGTESPLDHNDRQIGKLHAAVLVQIVGVSALSVAGALLASRALS